MKPIIVGNWKMNNSFSNVLDFTEVVNTKFENLENVEIGVCIPSVYLMVASKDGNLGIGAQNVFYEDSGAYTGELSIHHLNDCMLKYCIIGHSERREIFKETDEDINRKLRKLQETSITPIVCIGENEEQYDNNESKQVVKTQLVNALNGIDNVNGVVFAYEPIWAIGTGKSATSDYAEEMCKYVREVVGEMFDVSSVRVQYGGSVKPENIKEYMSKPNIDGALVGGASLDEASFIKLVESI